MFLWLNVGMTEHNRSEAKQGLSKQRVEALSDAIFAFAMTLLVLDVKIPKLPESPAMDDFLCHTLLGLWPRFLTFVMSFVILGIFWIAHHGYLHFFKRVDRYFLWINLLFLMVVVFVPFSADLLGSYPTHRISAFVYGCNISLLGLMLLWQWTYATDGHRLVGHQLELELIRKGKQRIKTGFLINGFAMLLAIFNPIFSLVVYVLLPFIYLLPSRLDDHWTHSHD